MDYARERHAPTTGATNRPYDRTPSNARRHVCKLAVRGTCPVPGWGRVRRSSRNEPGPEMGGLNAVNGLRRDHCRRHPLRWPGACLGRELCRRVVLTGYGPNMRPASSRTVSILSASALMSVAADCVVTMSSHHPVWWTATSLARPLRFARCGGYVLWRWGTACRRGNVPRPT